MANLDRIYILRSFIDEEPENPFNYYALALELRENQPSEAAKLFDFLLERHPNYLATYYPSAHFFWEQPNLERARFIFENGITLAQNLKEEKALKELKNAYQNFLFENDLD